MYSVRHLAKLVSVAALFSLPACRCCATDLGSKAACPLADSQLRSTVATELPAHLVDFPGLWVRDEDGVPVTAPAVDEEVARRYARSREKGPLAKSGERITILAAKETYSPGEEIRIIHVYEATREGLIVYMMGPQPVYGEEVDGVPCTPPWQPVLMFNGLVQSSPAVTFNFDITSYRLRPGRHRIRWQTHGPTDELEGTLLTSNELRIEVR